MTPLIVKQTLAPLPGFSINISHKNEKRGFVFVELIAKCEERIHTCLTPVSDIGWSSFSPRLSLHGF